MPGVMDIIVRARDEASSVLERVGDAGEKAGDVIDRAWLPATAALTTAGAAIEATARKQQAMTVSTRQLAGRIGESEDTVRSWATELSDAGFDLDEVVGLMDLASKRGLEGQSALQTYASFWDTVADATGESAVALGEAGVGLSGLGIAAGEEAKALDALGFVTENTTSSAKEFLDFVTRTGPELREMNVGVNDAAAILGVLENELGLSGRVARTEFRSAVSESDGTLQGMLDTLGISQEQFGAWRGEVEGSGEAIERNAEIFNDALTPLQQFQATLADVAYSFAPVVEGAANLAPLLMAAGPAAKGAKLAFDGLTKAGPLLGAAMHAALGPIGLITGAVALLAAGFATDFLGMRTRLETDIDDMAMNFGTMGDAVHRLADETGTDFQAMKDRIKAEMAETGDSFEQVVRRIEAGGTKMADTQWEAVEESGRAWEAYQEQIRTGVTNSEEVVEEGVEGMADELGTLPEQGADEMLANQQKLVDATTQLVDFMEEALDPAQEMARLQGFLTSSELAEGLASNNPMVVAKANELKAAAEARIAELNGYQYGASFSSTFALGISENAWKAQSAAAGMAQVTRSVMPSSEPKDPSSPFRGITTAWGFMDVLADGLRHHADRPAEVMARAMGLVRDAADVDAEIGIGVVPAGGFAGGGIPGLPGEGGTQYHEHTHLELHVEGRRPEPVETLDDLLDRLVELEIVSDARIPR